MAAFSADYVGGQHEDSKALLESLFQSDQQAQERARAQALAHGHIGISNFEAQPVQPAQEMAESEEVPHDQIPRHPELPRTQVIIMPMCNHNACKSCVFG